MNQLVLACFFGCFWLMGFFFLNSVCGFLFEFVPFGCRKSGRKKERELNFGSSHLSPSYKQRTRRPNMRVNVGKNARK